MNYRKSLLAAVLCMAALTAWSQKIDPLTESQLQKRLKTDLVGSYPQHIEESLWQQDAWVPFSETQINYRSDGQPSRIETADQTGVSRQTYSYLPNGLESEWLLEVKAGDSWTPAEKEVNTYTADDYPESNLGYTWSGTDWELTSGIQFAYTEVNDQITTLTVSYLNEFGNWAEENKYHYTYSGNSQMASQVITQFKEDGEWVNFSRASYTFSGMDITRVVMELWEDGSWMMNSKMDYSYGNFGSFMVLTSSWLGDAWFPLSRMTTENDEHGNAILDLFEYFSSEWMIISGFQFDLTYQGNNVTQRITRAYAFGTKTSGGDWVNQQKEVFSDFASLSTGSLEKPDADVTVYPNPASSELNILLEGIRTEQCQISVIDMLGASVHDEIIQISGDRQVRIPVHQLKSGVYFIKVWDHKDLVDIRKILITH